ncbi:MAG: family 78 glycoside hydrolase catalytic domain [Clostridia bacterium]|nr:family 78 glycoside hydrolase catalytic domain [Clostridia bacterium]MBQ4574712.1 family 78 glycoside hydrolase catalytic domain [Clostridia bacterium]
MLKITVLFIDGGRLREGCRFCTIDSATPRFSWSAASSETDNMQSACRVCVEGFWDSGWVETDEQELTYGGLPLPAGIPLSLSVSIRDKNGEESEPYDALFVSGLLSEDQIKGKWIGIDGDTNGRVLYFRRDFTLSEKPESACLYVCGLGYHRVTIGGIDITDALLEPAHSNYAKIAYYTVHPDAASFLETGHNVLGIQVAEGWRNNYSDTTKAAIGDRKLEFAGRSQLWAVLELRYADGRREVIATDERWGVRFGPITASSIYHGEIFDARLNDAGWNTGEAVGFESAVILPPPGGVLRPMSLEPIRQVAEYSPLEITNPKPGSFVVDFGQNIAGVVRMILPDNLRSGQQITLRFAEELDEDGSLYTAPLRDAKCTDIYIAAGDRRDLMVWEPRFTFHGFRYCEITGVDFVSKEDLTALLRCTDLKNGSSFSCGSALVNQIQKNVVMTEMDNMHSILSDCPQRDERMGWFNDATVRFEETPYNFDIGRIFPKIVRDVRAEQRADGAISCCCPYYFGCKPADPVCSSYLIAAYETWMHTGNRAILEESIDGLAAWEDFLLSQSIDYIVNYSYYGDWAAPYYACVNQEIDAAANAETEGILMSTGYSYFNCKLLVKMAGALGREDIAAKYGELAEKVRDAFLAKWFDPQSAKVGKGSQGAQAFALWLEILPLEYRQAAADVMAADLIERDYRFTTGNLCTRYLFDMLAKYGYIDIAWKLLAKETYPSYGYMIQNEATTVWERFEMKKNPGMNSHNHPMYGAVGYFFYASLAGVTPIDRGWKRIRVAPILPEGLLSVHAVVDTVMGDVSVRWAVRYGKRYLFLQIPFGSTAEVDFCGIHRELGSGYHVIEA